jgi:hypothetical protein
MSRLEEASRVARKGYFMGTGADDELPVQTLEFENHSSVFTHRSSIHSMEAPKWARERTRRSRSTGHYGLENR